MKEPFPSWLYLAGLVIATLVRVAYARRTPSESVQQREPEPRVVAVAMAIWAASQVVCVVYVMTPWVDRFNYFLPVPVQMLGLMLLATALLLLWRSHADLGRHWAATLEIHEDHELVTSGVYRWIRHPMYTAHLIWSVAQSLLIGNWLAGPTSLLAMGMLCYWRIPHEERLLQRKFGEAYEVYRRHTGGLWPRGGAAKDSC